MAIAGFYMMNQPVAALATLTIILMSYLLATGVLEIIVAFQLKPADGWGLQLSGRPSDCSPGLPQIRTCGTPASGSSSQVFAE